MNKNIEFRAIDWEQIAIGAKQKQYQTQHKRIRLLHLDENLLELHWSINVHIGYLLNGELTLDSNGNQIDHKVGDTFIKKEGESEKHKQLFNLRNSLNS